MKKALPYIIGTILILGGIVARGFLKWHTKQSEHDARQQEREASMDDLKQRLSSREQEQKEN
jgi:hypothetical protein